LNYFRDEYTAHIRDKRCPTGNCAALASYRIIPEKCKGCSRCAKKCPAAAISGEVKNPFVIDPEKCIRCGLCISNCKASAIVKG
jgi:ferredoxin